jgi:hypothetical protein
LGLSSWYFFGLPGKLHELLGGGVVSHFFPVSVWGILLAHDLEEVVDLGLSFLGHVPLLGFWGDQLGLGGGCVQGARWGYWGRMQADRHPGIILDAWALWGGSG